MALSQLCAVSIRTECWAHTDCNTFCLALKDSKSQSLVDM